MSELWFDRLPLHMGVTGIDCTCVENLTVLLRDPQSPGGTLETIKNLILWAGGLFAYTTLGILKGRLMDQLMGTQTTLDRLGLQSGQRVLEIMGYWFFFTANFVKNRVTTQ